MSIFNLILDAFNFLHLQHVFLLVFHSSTLHCASFAFIAGWCCWKKINFVWFTSGPLIAHESKKSRRRRRRKVSCKEGTVKAKFQWDSINCHHEYQLIHNHILRCWVFSVRYSVVGCQICELPPLKKCSFFRLFSLPWLWLLSRYRRPSHLCSLKLSMWWKTHKNFKRLKFMTRGRERKSPQIFVRIVIIQSRHFVTAFTISQWSPPLNYG